MIKSIYNARCSGAQQNELILLTEDELLGSDLTSHGPHRKFIKCMSGMHSGRIGLPYRMAVTATFPLMVSWSVRPSGAHGQLLVKDQH
jgi:hypothetical protein